MTMTAASKINTVREYFAWRDRTRATGLPTGSDLDQWGTVLVREEARLATEEAAQLLETALVSPEDAAQAITAALALLDPERAL